MSNRKKREALPRDLEIRGAEIFGKHLSPEKQRALLIVTLTACALPMILGVRMWDRIPEIVETGLIGPGGQDDSLPRWAVALLLPGLMCLLEGSPDLLVAVHPTRGLDIGATRFVHDTMIEARDKGCGVLLISADFDEILEVSDRIVVMFEGQIMGVFSGKNPPIEEISLAMAGK